MSYQEKRTMLSIVSGILFLIIYFSLVSSMGLANNLNVKDWASFMLKFIGISIVVIIILQILFHILQAISISIKERTKDEKMIEKKVNSFFITDEMDKIIELKSARVSYAFVGFGFIGSLISIVLGYNFIFMLNLIFVSFSVGSIIEGFVSLYYYRKGIR